MNIIKWLKAFLFSAVAFLFFAVKGRRIDKDTNEMRFFGDRGDGTIEELACIGVTAAGSDHIVGAFGSTNNGSNTIGVYGKSKGNFGVIGLSVDERGVKGYSSNSYGIHGESLYQTGAYFKGHSQHSAVILELSSTGSQSITANGGTWTPSVPGVYNFVDASTSADGAVVYPEIYVTGGWRTPGRAVQTAGFTLYCDGTNVRLKNTDPVSAHTVYWQRF